MINSIFSNTLWRLNSILHSLGIQDRKSVINIKFKLWELINRFYVGNKIPLLNIYRNREEDPYLVELFKESLNNADIVMDIGANVGYFTAIASGYKVKDGKIFAFEPAPRYSKILDIMSETCKNANISIVKKAVSNTSGVSRFYEYSVAGVSSLVDHQEFGRPINIIEVITISLDEFCYEHNIEGVDVIKIDIEGNEVKALQGMRETIANNKELILFTELNPSMLVKAGSSANELITTLCEMGFQVMLIDEEKRCLSPVNGKEDIFKDMLAHYNLYCIKS